ncbi:TetR/AcrR family transcriptional regulator [Paenibacillus protaetiae]|uniref:TetR/AcrR family transcriptional regulator n=1 Tax=Paenibacillus protaetiae TaxID=2509456 RepID=A0A4P6EUP8_9BACL|nr:TetR/AcrR family transcriptional regulator [Paenibacillus protaetiae]QAY65369.1 TetR/AcrR family transcriptional regulator [Paenibacillus protaetiae]
MNKQNLRDIKKEATANALADAAFELVLERGMDGFTVDDIVQKAGYARRTFANHFSCKEEAVVSGAVTFKSKSEAEDLIAQLPHDASPLDILHRLMRMQLTADLLRKLRQIVSLSKDTPSLEPYIFSTFHDLQTTAQQTLDELSHGQYPAGYSHLLAGAVYGAAMPLLDGSLDVLLPGEPEERSPEAIPLDQYLDSIFSYLRSGF